MKKQLKLTIKELTEIFEKEFNVSVNLSMVNDKIDVIEFLIDNNDFTGFKNQLCEKFYIDEDMIGLWRKSTACSLLKIDIIDTMTFIEEKFDLSLSFDYSLINSYSDIVEIVFEIL